MISNEHFLLLGKSSTDACSVREDHRIVGHLVGCLPRLPRQNISLGLPLQLLKEEAALLIQRGLAKVITDDSSLPLPNQEEVEKFVEKREDLYNDQRSSRREERKQVVLKHASKVLEGKKGKKRKELKKREEKGEHVTAEEWKAIDAMELDVDAMLNHNLQRENSFIQIHTATPELHRRREDIEFEWSFPATNADKLRCAAFSELWCRGFFLTSAGKFGGDFLVYPGDPCRFHSKYIAVCLPEDQKFTNLDMTSIARLGTAVKKLLILVDEMLKYGMYTSEKQTPLVPLPGSIQKWNHSSHSY
ncbi:hypothetical protein CAPTEDRAFT_218766, partial [Capitella teleta]